MVGGHLLARGDLPVGEAQGAGHARIDPLAIWLFAGLAVGGIGEAIAFLGGLRWVQANRGHL